MGNKFERVTDDINYRASVELARKAQRAGVRHFIFASSCSITRFGWELGPEGGEAPIVGFDVAVTDGAGQIQRVHGFLDRVPAA